MDATKSIFTGVTAILPLGESKLQKTPRKSIGYGIDSFVPAAWWTHNGVGEMTGTNCIEESGYLEGPIMLTNTASVGTVRDAVIQYWLNRLLTLVDNDPTQIDPDYDFDLLLPVVAETYDGWLNDILGFHVDYDMVDKAITSARAYSDSADVDEGNVGGGTGMTCYDWKGGIGTSSRNNILLYRYNNDEPPTQVAINDPNYPKGYTVGVLVQANQGTYWDLVIRGVPVGTKMTPPDSADDPPQAGNPGPVPVSTGCAEAAQEREKLDYRCYRNRRTASARPAQALRPAQHWESDGLEQSRTTTRVKLPLLLQPQISLATQRSQH